METKRQKLFKQKINNIFTESDSIKKGKTRNKSENQTVNNKLKPSKKINTKPPNLSDPEVTLLGSASYHEQNKIMLSLELQPVEKNVQIIREEDIDRTEETYILNTNVQETCTEERTKVYCGKRNPNTQITQKKSELNKIMETEAGTTQKDPEANHNGGLTLHVFEIDIEIEEETLHDDGDTREKINTVEHNGIFETQNQEQIVNKKSNNSNMKSSEKAETQQQNRTEDEESDRLTPSIREEISEKEMDELRKSLEEGRNSVEISLPFTNDSLPEKFHDVAEKHYATALKGAEDLLPPAEKYDEAAIGETDKVTSATNDDVLVSESNNQIVPFEEDCIITTPEQGDNLERPEKKKRENRQRVIMKKSYVDFLSEEEDFIWDSTSWKETDDEAASSELENYGKKRKINKKRSNEGLVGEDGIRIKKLNKKQFNKQAKYSGREYKKTDGKSVRAKELQANPCVGRKCGHNCVNISEERRKAIFDHYWSLTMERKKDWLVAMSSKIEVKRKRSKDSSYRENTFEYFINEGEGRRQVCLQFIMKTLDVSQRYIYYTLSNAVMGSAKSDQRGKVVPANKTSDAFRLSAVNFIKKLPALPSHYSRKDSTKLYLPVEMKNIKNLYRIYKEEQLSQGVAVVTERIFRDIFNKDFNLGFHIPKKDKCLKCLRFEGQDISQNEEMIKHLGEKGASKKRLEFHREIAKKNPSIICASFDLQKVLNTPYGNSMLLFYSRKYTVFNLCFYESRTRNGYCYVWGETEGKRGANEIGTILSKYINTCDQRGTVKSLILYSDSCPGQNKNKIVLAAIHSALLLCQNIETIQMNYLLPGHTEMTVDSIHSTIENSVRNTIVWAPSQWLTICQLARRDPKPYIVEALTHDNFKNFEEFSDKYFKANLVGKTSKIRVATFKKSSPSTMTVKYSMRDDAQEECISIFAKPKSLNAKYKSSLPITKSKYNDLKKLCDTGVIPKIFQHEYINLPYNNGKEKEVLIDTDIEDVIEETN